CHPVTVRASRRSSSARRPCTARRTAETTYPHGRHHHTCRRPKRRGLYAVCNIYQGPRHEISSALGHIDGPVISVRTLFTPLCTERVVKKKTFAAVHSPFSFARIERLPRESCDHYGA